MHATPAVYARLAAVLALALMASGCVAAAALPALGLSAMGDVAGAGAKAGIDYSIGGTAYRTFSAPLDDVRCAVLQSFSDLEIDIADDETPDDDSVKISAEAFRRKITVQLEAVTPALTRLKMVVRRGWFGRDRATATELIEQAARALADIRPIAGASPRAP